MSDEGLIARLRAYIPVEGQEGIAVRDRLMKEAAGRIEHLARSNKGMFERLAPSLEYVEGTAVGYGEDEIDRLRHDLERATANHTADLQHSGDQSGPSANAAMLENYAQSYDGMDQVSGSSVAYDIRRNMIPALSAPSATEQWKLMPRDYTPSDHGHRTTGDAEDFTIAYLHSNGRWFTFTVKFPYLPEGGSPIAPEARRKVRFCYATQHPGQADEAWASGLAHIGDARLVWVNEGDIISLGEEINTGGERPTFPSPQRAKNDGS